MQRNANGGNMIRRHIFKLLALLPFYPLIKRNALCDRLPEGYSVNHYHTDTEAYFINADSKRLAFIKGIDHNGKPYSKTIFW